MKNHPNNQMKKKRPGNILASPHVMLVLLILTFLAGVLLGGRRDLILLETEPVNDLTPATATAFPPTPTVAVTPTPTSPQQDVEALTTLYIDIKPDDFAKLEDKREEALESWILQSDDSDYVPATVRLGEQAEIPVELRLKGDWGDHFAGEKWSFRIRTRDDHYVEGMAVFSVQDPGTRTYLNEWLFLMNVRQEDVLGVRYDFVHLVQNGEYKGIYALEEGFARELFEAQGRREGVMLRYNEDLLWEFWADYDNDEVVPAGLQVFHIIDEFQTGRVVDNPALLEQRNIAAGKLQAWQSGERPFGEVFDIDSMARFLAMSDLWGAEHAFRWHNLRFYYNPITTLLEPVAFDSQPLAHSAISLETLPGLSAVRSYEDLELQRAYIRYLWEYSQPDYLDTLKAELSPRFEHLQAALEPELGEVVVGVHQTGNDNPLQASEADVEFVSVLASPWEALAKRQASLNEMLEPIHMVYASMPQTTTLTNTISMDIGNLVPFPVEITGLWVGETWYPADDTWQTEDPQAYVLPPESGDATFMTYRRYLLPITGSDIETQPLSLETRLWGMTQTVTQPVLLNYPSPLVTGPLPISPSLEEVLTAHPYIHETTEPYLLEVTPGAWDVMKDLVLPEGYGLRITAGTQISFGQENYILARGPLFLEGTEDAPITLQAMNGTWQGMVVLNAGTPSFWHHVNVRDTVAPSTPGWGLTGGVTLYNSPVKLDNCSFIGTQAEDALNLVQTHFELVDVEFSDTASDAFDADFCQGTLTRAYFHDIGADGLDVSGSDIVVHDLRMERLGDKGLSIGENSRLQGTDVWLDDMDFGVVSKDLSRVEITNVTLQEVHLAGFAAYIKKPAYGPATITANNVTFSDESTTEDQLALVQTGCRVDLNGTRYWGEPLDIEALYEKWQR